MAAAEAGVAAIVEKAFFQHFCQGADGIEIGVVAGGFATDCVDAIDRQHGHHAAAGAIAETHRVAMTRRAGNPGFSVSLIGGEGLAGVAVDDGEVEQAAGVDRHDGEQRNNECSDQGAHGESPVGKLIQRGRARGGVNALDFVIRAQAGVHFDFAVFSAT